MVYIYEYRVERAGEEAADDQVQGHEGHDARLLVGGLLLTVSSH